MLKRGDTLVLASHNKGKLREIETTFAPFGLNIELISKYSAEEPVEDGATFIANATIKARAAMQLSNLPSLADDSGLSVPALNGEPGVDTKPFVDAQGGYDIATQNILQRAGTPQTRAQFTCVLILSFPDGREIQAIGELPGTLTYPGSGGEGFGFDPYFIPDGDTETMATLGIDVKNKISHRALALRQMIEKLDLS